MALFAKKQKDIKIKRKRTWDDHILYGLTNFILVFALIIVAYPILYVIACSFSSGSAINRGEVWVWPVGFNLEGYKLLFSYKSIWMGYKNTIFYTVICTTCSVITTVMCAYPLSRPNYQGRRGLATILTLSMMFGAGLIPKYLLYSNLHLTNTRWVIIINGLFGVWNTILVRTFFQSSIPNELIEAARIDGCTELRTLFQVVLPLSTAVLAVISLYYGVSNWNGYFEHMIYLRDRELMPLSIIVRDILLSASINLEEIEDPELLQQMTGVTDVIKYCTIVVTSGPIIAAYPFVQKYFKKGVMIGSIKG